MYPANPFRPKERLHTRTYGEVAAGTLIHADTFLHNRETTEAAATAVILVNPFLDKETY